MTFRIHSEANREFAESLQYYIDEKTPATAVRFEESIDRSYEEIIENPTIFAPDADGIRTKYIKGFPEHSIEYRVDDSEIAIFAIRHHKRKPGFWSSRI